MSTPASHVHDRLKTNGTAIMQLLAAIGEGRGGGGVTPGTYAGMARDLSTLFDNFKPGMGGLDCFCTFSSRITGERPTGFVNICKYLQYKAFQNIFKES